MRQNPLELGYARESKENRQALLNQVKALKASGCSRVLADVESGQKDDRRFFNMALELMRSGRYTTLKVPRLDRLSRVLQTHIKIQQEFKELGLKLIALDFGEIDTSTPVGWQACIQSAFNAELYSHQLSYNVKIGKQGSRDRHHQLGGPLIFGFNRINKKLEIDPDLYPIARERIELFLGGLPLYGVAKILSERGHRVSPSGLRDWLLNPHVYGHTAYGRKKSFKGNPDLIFSRVVYDTHEPIGTASEWEQVKTLIRESSRRRGKAKTHPPRPLSGLIFCNECGYAMACTLNGKRWVVRHPGHRLRECGHTGIYSYDELEAAVNLSLSNKASEIIKKTLTLSEAPNPALVEKRSELEKAIAMQQTLNAPELEKLIDRLQFEISHLEANAHLTDLSKKERQDLLVTLQDPDIFNEFSRAERRDIYRQLVRRLTVWNKEIIKIKLWV